jgi:hypothetical protein
MQAAQTMTSIKVSVVAFQEGDLWVAQCVEYDIAAHATDLTRLPAAFERAIMANVCVNLELGRQGLEGIPEPPRRFQEMFDSGMELKPRKPHARAQGAVQIGRLRVAELQGV